jgi:RNA polymerase sigma-70 factor (ECF subfamily)
MSSEELSRRLNNISTMWTVLRQAHEGPPDAATAAKELLLRRYSGAIYRYLVSILGDAATADDLTQEFGLSLVRGQFKQVDPERGRFRNYLKTVLLHLVSDYRRKQMRQPRQLPEDNPDAGSPTVPELDQEFNESWRQELLARTWSALAEAQTNYHEVLRFRAEHPKMRSHEMAEQLTRRLGRPFSPEGVRQTLRRARDRFAELLIDEVAQSLDQPTPEQVEQELAELRLLDYCRPILDRNPPGGK